MSAWNPAQYEKFKDERERPFRDLMSLVEPPPPAGRAVDLGCGTGAQTRQLHERLGLADTLGLDSSPEMLARAEGERAPGLRFAVGDLSAFVPEAPLDLIFSNAAFQWCDGHAALLERLRDGLKPGGQLAFQVPANSDYPTHRLAVEMAAERAGELGGAVPTPAVSVLRPEVYAELLHDLGFVDVDVQLRVYPHVLASRDEVLSWVRGTLLTWFAARMSGEGYAGFEAEYARRLAERLPERRPFFYPFKRILARARRPSSG